MGIRHLPYTTRSNILFALLLTLASPVTPLVLQNITIALPPGSSDHGTPGLLCTPTKPIDLLTFYLLNYVAHAATVLTRPGERADDYFVSVIGSLLFPALGLYRGIEAILSGAVCVRDDDLRKAARSGALCVVVRGADWRPVDGEIITHAIYKRPADTKGLQETRRTFTGETLTEEAKENAVHVIPYFPPYIFTRFGLPVFVHRRIIHGTHTLPPGYRFAILPHDAQFASPSTDQPTIEVSATYNIVKALIALVQSVYALTTLYRARGDQISQFGYAAFGLTVAPYAVMSITNLIGNLCRPEYPSLYMVESSIMDEARKRGGLFEAAGVRVQEDERLQVCNCGFANGEELDDLHFAANEDGEVEAHFSTTDPLAYVKQREVEQNTEKTLTASTLETKFPLPARSLLLPQTHALAPTPKKLNYINTQNNALLLIPCHTPLIRFTPPTSSSIIETPPPRSLLSALSLRRTRPFSRHYTWTPRFHPSRTSIIALRWRWTKYISTTFIALLPLLILGILSNFCAGTIPAAESTNWRVFTVQWLSFGVLTGLSFVLDQEGKDAMASGGAQVGPWVRVVKYVVSASPAVGGYIVVGQMLYRYGTCVWVGD